ncbi:MAG: cupin domain-containing protein [Bacteroidetes bacterium]|nr:cupin domain-containing protein [Bacteroidota bacterium]
MENIYGTVNRRNILKHLSFGVLSSITLLNTGCHSDTGQKYTELEFDTSKPLKPVLTKAGETRKAPDGIDFGFKLRSNQTNGQFSCTEEILAPKTLGVSLHKHDKLDEILHVLEGTVHVLVGDEVFEVNAGDWHLRPHGIPHAYWNQTDKPARFNDMFLNQDFDNFLDELLRIADRLSKQNIPPDSKKAEEVFAPVAKKYGFTNYPEQTPILLEKYGLKMASL